MGCWNENIYGGDNALDARASIYQLCGAEEYNSKNEVEPVPTELLKSKMVEIQEYLDSQDEEDKNIGYIVLAAIIMHSGVHFAEPLMDRVMWATENDEWAEDNQLRRMVMKNYRKLIKDYNPEEPIDVEAINLLEETEPTALDILSEEFQQIYGIIAARTAKLKRNMDEKSGVKEYDEGVADANQEEIDFLAEFKELLERHEQFGNLLEKIEDGMKNGFAGIASGGMTGAKISSGGSSSGGKDIMPG
jgi:hypothetical protein